MHTHEHRNHCEHDHPERVRFELHPAQARQLLSGLSIVANQTGEQGPGSYYALLKFLTHQARERYARLNLDG